MVCERDEIVVLNVTGGLCKSVSERYYSVLQHRIST